MLFSSPGPLSFHQALDLINSENLPPTLTVLKLLSCVHFCSSAVSATDVLFLLQLLLSCCLGCFLFYVTSLAHRLTRHRLENSLAVPNVSRPGGITGKYIPANWSLLCTVSSFRASIICFVYLMALMCLRLPLLCVVSVCLPLVCCE